MSKISASLRKMFGKMGTGVIPPERQLDPKSLILPSAFVSANFIYSGWMIYSHTFDLQNYLKRFWIRYQHGFPLELNKKLVPITEQVLEDLKLPKDRFAFFPCNGYTPQAIGNYRFTKLCIGMPFYFDYRSRKNIDKNEILLYGEHSPNWKSPDGKEFLKNLVLSEKAKKYAIAEQIHRGMIWSNSLWFDAAPFFASVYSAFICVRQEWYYKMNKKFMRPPVRFAAAVGWAAVLYGFSLVLFSRLRDYMENEAVDKFLEKLKGNQSYIDGGLEYYIKMQKRNIIQRTFFGDEGSWFFRANGDAIKYLSASYPITEMIKKLSEIDRFDLAQGLNKIPETQS